MLCIKCGEENPDSAKFCSQCEAEYSQDTTSQEIREVLYRVKEFFDKKEYDKGIEYCNSCLKKYSKNPLFKDSLFYNDLAAFYIKKENFEEAKKYCQLALDKNPNLKSAKEIEKYLQKKEKTENFKTILIYGPIFILIMSIVSYLLITANIKSGIKKDQQEYARKAVVNSEDYQTGFRAGYLYGKDDKGFKRSFLYSCKPETFSNNEEFKQGFRSGYSAGYYGLK